MDPVAIHTAADLRVALDTVPDRARLELAPGTYEGPFRLDRPLALIGTAGAASDVRIISDARSVITLAHPAASLERVTVELAGALRGDDDRYAIVCADGGILRRVVVRSDQGSGICVEADSAPELDRIAILGAGRFGLTLVAAAGGRYSGLTARGCRIAAILVGRDAAPRMRDLMIDGPGTFGLSLLPGAAGSYEVLDLADVETGVRIGRGAVPRIVRVRASGCRFGLVASAGAAGEIEDLRADDAETGLTLEAGAATIVRRLRSRRSEVGVHALPEAAGEIFDIDIEDSISSGLRLGDGSTTAFQHGRIVGGLVGVLASGARARLLSLLIEDTLDTAVVATGRGTEITLVGGQINRAGLGGVAAIDGARVQIVSTGISEARGAGLLASGTGSHIEAIDPVISGSSRAGLEIMGAASAHMLRGSLAKNETCGAWIGPEGTCTLDRTAVMGHRHGAGVLSVEGATVEIHDVIYANNGQDRLVVPNQAVTTADVAPEDPPVI